MLRVSQRVVRQVIDEAKKAYPEECCGFLIGKIPEGFERLDREIGVEAIRPLPNGWDAGQRDRRYRIDPKVFLEAERELAEAGRAVIGFYHSHPDVPAWPSPFDLERAWPCYSYWIVCVRGGEGGPAAAESRSWVRSRDGNSFIEEQVMEVENDEHSSKTADRAKAVRGA